MALLGSIGCGLRIVGFPGLRMRLLMLLVGLLWRLGAQLTWLLMRMVMCRFQMQVALCRLRHSQRFQSRARVFRRRQMRRILTRLRRTSPAVLRWCALSASEDDRRSQVRRLSPNSRHGRPCHGSLDALVAGSRLSLVVSCLCTAHLALSACFWMVLWIPLTTWRCCIISGTVLTSLALVPKLLGG